MRRIREVFRLVLECKLSNRKAAASLGIGRCTVDEYVRRAAAAKLAWPLPPEVDDAALEALLFPPTPSRYAIDRPKPDFVWIQDQLKQRRVNLALLWYEYKEKHPGGYQYSAFCYHYRQWLARAILTQHATGASCWRKDIL